MTTKDDVILAHRNHPKWGAPEIAKALRCTGAYVRKTARRNAISLPIGRREPVVRRVVEAPSLTARQGEYYVIHRDGMAINLPMLSILRD